MSTYVVVNFRDVYSLGSGPLTETTAHKFVLYKLVPVWFRSYEQIVPYETSCVIFYNGIMRIQMNK